MKSALHFLALFSVVTIICLVTVNIQQVSAPRTCGSCIQFKKLTHEFEKNVIEAATIGDPNIIPNLLEQYNDQVARLFTGPE